MKKMLYRRKKYNCRGCGVLLALFLLTIFRGVGAQETRTVTGVILSPAGEPVPEVAVNVEGSADLPVITDSTGMFRLEGVRGNDWIIVSPAGDYKTRRLYVGDRTELTLYVAHSDFQSGDDPVRIQSRQIPRKNLVGAVSEVNTGEILYEPAVTVDEYLRGRVAGLHVTKMSGMPASGAVLAMRGLNSIHAHNEPLVLVDGIPHLPRGIFSSNLAGFEYNPYQDINMLDISRIILVKDPVLTAPYGSRASNGILMIETLDPSVTQTSIELNYRNSFSLAPETHIPQLNAAQHRTLMSEILFSSDLLEEEIVERYPNLFLTEEDDRYIDYQHDTHWQDYVFRNALLTNYNIKVKGGDEIARYGLSFGYNTAGGIVENTSYRGYNLRFVGLLNVFEWLKMDAGVSLNRTSASLMEAATVRETSPVFTSLAKSPLLNPYQYDPDGNEISILSDVDELGVSNPLSTVRNFSASNSHNAFNALLGFTGTLTRNLTLKTLINLGYRIMREDIFMPNEGMELYYNGEAWNVSKASNNSINTIYNNTFLSYTQTFNRDHHLSSVTGMHVQTNRFEFDWGLTKNALINDEYRNLQDGRSDLREIGGSNRTWNWISLYEHLTYSFRNRYILNASVSLDGSSRVGDEALNTVSLAGQPFGLFYSGGAAWRISGEPFLDAWPWIEDLKVRVSAGKTGTDDIGETTATRYYQSIKFRETSGLVPGTIPNPFLTYETVESLNGGLDLSLVGYRVSLKFDYFRNITRDMLIFSPVNPLLGFDVKAENGGSMQNTGWEADLFLRIFDTEKFTWDFSANVSMIENEIISLPGEKQVASIPGGERVNMVGEPAYSFYGYQYNGVFSGREEASQAGLVNERGIPFGAGDAFYTDFSGPDGDPDGVIDGNDKIPIGSSMPDRVLGIHTRIRYGRFSLHASLHAVSGLEVFNYLRFLNESMSTLDNQSTSVLSRWQYEGQETAVPRASWEDPVGNSDFSTRWIEDGSYLRISNVTLSYRIPDKFLLFNDLEVYLAATNLYTLSTYLGYDPEFSYSVSPLYQGVDYGQMPIPRQFMAGIKLGL